MADAYKLYGDFTVTKTDGQFKEMVVSADSPLAGKVTSGKVTPANASSVSALAGTLEDVETGVVVAKEVKVGPNLDSTGAIVPEDVTFTYPKDAQ